MVNTAYAIATSTLSKACRRAPRSLGVLPAVKAQVGIDDRGIRARATCHRQPVHTTAGPSIAPQHQHGDGCNSRPTTTSPRAPAPGALTGGGDPIPAGRALSAERTCHDVLPAGDLLAWAPGTVAQFRAHLYGGPRTTVPLGHAFRGVSGGTRGPSCRNQGRTASYPVGAVIVGHRAASSSPFMAPEQVSGAAPFQPRSPGTNGSAPRISPSPSGELRGFPQRGKSG